MKNEYNEKRKTTGKKRSEFLRGHGKIGLIKKRMRNHRIIGSERDFKGFLKEPRIKGTFLGISGVVWFNKESLNSQV